MVRGRCLRPCPTGRARARLDGDAEAQPGLRRWHPPVPRLAAQRPGILARNGRTRRRAPGLGRRGAAAPGRRTAGLLLCGHTHHPRVVRTAAGQLLVNPGSVGLPAYDDERPYPHVIENGSPDARYAIVEQVDGAWQAQLLAVPYDHESMARLADAARPARLGLRAAHRLHARTGLTSQRGGRRHHPARPCDLPCSTWTTRCSAATATCCGATSCWTGACWTRVSASATGRWRAPTPPAA